MDVFGRSRDTKITTFRSAPQMRTADSEKNAVAYLPPRLSQPARLKFDFLSAASDAGAGQPAGIADLRLAAAQAPRQCAHRP